MMSGQQTGLVGVLINYRERFDTVLAEFSRQKYCRSIRQWQSSQGIFDRNFP